ncbi:hypothetical protein CCH79_00014540 [Gambusia affinis]|uniref:Uncharacterized protein n=1 Tax=Gambusia affinis TaxID=33528 RepID=A0A315V735_GAMAF|nr:hypothetical protein CCH79_00014540 [Gambusia affinis]
MFLVPGAEVKPTIRCRQKISREPHSGRLCTARRGTRPIDVQPWFLIRPLLCAQLKGLNAAAADLAAPQPDVGSNHPERLHRRYHR